MNNILILVFVIISIIVFSMVLKKKSEERTKNTTAIFETNKTKYFASLDKDINFRNLAKKDSLAGLLSLIIRNDVPKSVDKSYKDSADSQGSGRLLLALDYTRGTDTPSWWDAIKKGPQNVVTTQIITPMLTHFREIDGVEILRHDIGYAAPFRDSLLTSQTSNQTGHMLCALESGMRYGYYSKHWFQKIFYEAGLKTAGLLLGLDGVQPTIEDWSRAGIIGHEMVGSKDGFVGQMKAYGKLVSNGDPYKIRDSWDNAVKSVLNGDHKSAWANIRTITQVAEIPENIKQVEENKKNPAPRFAQFGEDRSGNSLQDMGLSVYGFAIGLKASTDGYPTNGDVYNDVYNLLSKDGKYAKYITLVANIK